MTCEIKSETTINKIRYLFPITNDSKVYREAHANMNSNQPYFGILTTN